MSNLTIGSNETPQPGLVTIMVPGQTDVERITRLETRMDKQDKDLAEIKQDLKQLLIWSSNISGGKKALITLASLAGVVLGVVAAIMGKLGVHPGH